MSSDKKDDGAGVPMSPDVEEDESTGYKPPAEKSLAEIVNADAEDESLVRYKQALLGEAAGGDNALIVVPDDPRRVIVQKLALVVEGRPDEELDLTAGLDEIKKSKFVIKEGIQFRIRIDFLVQREIVTGLKYIQKTSRMGVTVDKMTHMVGSYAPKVTAHSYTTPLEDAPSGMTGRGSYHVNSLFTDDDKNEHLKWEWSIEVKKDWSKSA